MIGKKSVILGIAALVALGMGAGAFLLGYVPNTKPTAIRLAKRIARSEMKDPASALFAGIKVSQDLKTVCGDINSKNGYGAYTGFSAFIVRRNHFTQGIVLDTDAFDNAIITSMRTDDLGTALSAQSVARRWCSYQRELAYCPGVPAASRPIVEAECDSYEMRADIAIRAIQAF